MTVIGPITYDAVSLWRDAYIEWEEEEQLDWLIRYWERARRAGCRWRPTSAISTAISSGWACSAT